MGILMMESFQRFAQVDFDNSGTGPLRPIQTDGEWREFTGFYSTADTTNGLLNSTPGYSSVSLVTDPIVATKTRLALGVRPTTTSHNYQHLYGLERNFATPRTKYTVGFLVRFRYPGYLVGVTSGSLTEVYGFEFCATGRNRVSLSTSNQPRYIAVGGTNTGNGMHAVVSADTMNTPTVAMNAATTPSFTVNGTPTFRMNGVADPNGVGVSMAMDTDHFFEVEVDITNKTLKVWMDDIYCGTTPWGDVYHNPLANGFQLRLMRMEGLNTYNASTDSGGIYLSDIYCVDNSDGVVPNSRLGKTTRVMGESPDKDISTMFTPPSGFAGNYDVINDPIANTSLPTNFLSGDGAGAEDMYQTAGSNIKAFAGTVYGVQIHARFQNASATTHQLAVTTDDGTTKTENSLGNIAAGTGVLMKSIVLNKTPSGAVWTPAAAAALKYGFKIVN